MFIPTERFLMGIDDLFINSYISLAINEIAHLIKQNVVIQSANSLLIVYI